MGEPRRYVCAACNDVSVVREETPEDRCMICDHDEWRDDGKPNWPADQPERIAELERRLFLQEQRRERFEEEVECAHAWLNDRGVPTADDGGNQYSLVGRMVRLVAKTATR